MSERETESGEERIDDAGRNETQQRIDAEGPSGEPADGSWDEQEWGETAPPRPSDEGDKPA